MMRTDIAPVHLPWMDAALCTETNPDLFFPDKSGNPNPAKRVCASCPAEILAIKFSGTVSEWARNRIRTLYPDVAIFSTVGQMLAEYPTTADGLEYRMDDDPDFWTREA